MNLTNIHRIWHPVDTEHSLSLRVHVIISEEMTFWVTKLVLASKKFFILIYFIFLAEINSKRNYKNYTNTWRLDNTLSDDQPIQKGN